MSKFCYNCGSELREGDAFCTKCGKAVAYQKEDVNTVEKSADTNKNGAHVNNNHVKYIVGATVSAIIVFIIIALCNINKGRSTKVAEENITDSMTETDSLSKEETKVSAKYELIGMSCSKFVSEYEQNGGSVIDGLDSTMVSIGKSDYERRAGWENWLTGFEYNLSNDCQIFMLQNVDKDDYCAILLFAENDIITSYYVYWDIGKIDVNLAQYIKETEFEEIKGLDESPTISTMIGTNKNGEKWDNNLECRPVFQNERYTVQFQAEKFDPKTGDALTDWGKMWFVGFYVALDSDEIYFQEAGNINNQDSAKESAKRFLSGIVGDYDDLQFSGTIMVMEETPSAENNNANYSIAGRGFSWIYDSDCIEADESIQKWVFKSNGYYYLMMEGLDGYYIYYDSDKQRLSESSECCGIFSTCISEEAAVGENDITANNFEKKVNLLPGDSTTTDSAMEAYKKEVDDSGSPYTFTYTYIGECSDGFYYYNGEGLSFNVYRITFKDGNQGIYFMPLNVGENMVWSLYDNYYELEYCWTQY